jgi:RNA polymerase sigma factor (sigma-70 family)
VPNGKRHNSERRLQIGKAMMTMRPIIICDTQAVAFMSSPEFAVQALYSNHHGWLHAWLRSRLGNAADAADLAQDTFVRLLARSERVEPKAPRAFLRTIAQGLVIDHWRREEIERAYLQTIAHLPESETPGAEAQALILELLEAIARMLEGLRPKVRKAFLLAQCEGLTYKQIAQQLGISLRSVERYVADALYHCYVLRYES